MNDTITQHVAGLAGEIQRRAVLIPFKAIGDRFSSQSLNTAGLRIKGGSASAIVQTNAAYLGIANNRLVKVASGVDLPALVGTVANATFNVFCFFIDQAGTTTTLIGTAGASLALVKFPTPPEGKAMIGFVQVNPTGTGGFVGGTTVLDDATVIPNAVFCNTLGAFDPTISL